MSKKLVIDGYVHGCPISNTSNPRIAQCMHCGEYGGYGYGKIVCNKVFQYRTVNGKYVFFTCEQLTPEETQVLDDNQDMVIKLLKSTGTSYKLTDGG